MCVHMKHNFVVSGLLEKNDKTYFVVDFDKFEFRKFSDIISIQNKYLDKDSQRIIALLPVEIHNSQLFKNKISAHLKSIKQNRLVNLIRSTYVRENKEVSLNVKPDFDRYFLKNNNFLREISRLTSPNKNVINYVTEKEIREFVNCNKKELFDKLSYIKNNLYTNDTVWKENLKKISVGLILPTYNEVNFESNIQRVHKLFKTGLVNEIIITDGYSTEYKPSSVKSKLLDKGIDIGYTIIKQNGSGKGEAIEAALKYAHAVGHDFVICVDSDNLPSIREVYPDSPLDMDIEYFVRKFISSIIKTINGKGIEIAKNTFFKASYLRMPQIKKTLDIRFGLATTSVKDFFSRYIHSEKNLYPLSGEIACNPKFFLEKLNLTKNLVKLINVEKEQYCGVNVPSGFCLENFWNAVIDVNHYNVYYVNMLLHHHGPVKKSSKKSIEDQRGEVMTGVCAGISASLSKNENMKKLFKKIPKDVIRSNRVILEIEGNIKNKKLVIKDYKIYD